MIFQFLSHFIFIGNSKKRKNIIFFMVFYKKWNFLQVHLSMVRKKKFRDGSDGPKNEFKTLLSNAAIKKCDRLIRFFTILKIGFFWFFVIQKMRKIEYSKNTIFAIFFSQFHQFCLFFVIFPVFCLQNPFLLSKF